MLPARIRAVLRRQGLGCCSRTTAADAALRGSRAGILTRLPHANRPKPGSAASNGECLAQPSARLFSPTIQTNNLYQRANAMTEAGIGASAKHADVLDDGDEHPGCTADCK
jgi:hypothetical protein